MTEAKGNRGVGRAEGADDGIILPEGTWWSTRFPTHHMNNHLGERWRGKRTLFMMEARIEYRFDRACRH